MIDKQPLTPAEIQEHVKSVRPTSKFVWREIAHVELTPWEDRVQYGDDSVLCVYPPSTIANLVDLRAEDVSLVGMQAILDLDGDRNRLVKIKKAD